MTAEDSRRDGVIEAARAAQGARPAFLTLREVAELLRLHERTIREYVRRGELTGRIIGGRWRFRREDVDSFCDAAPSSWEFGGDAEHRE